MLAFAFRRKGAAGIRLSNSGYHLHECLSRFAFQNLLHDFNHGIVRPAREHSAGQRNEKCRVRGELGALRLAAHFWSRFYVRIHLARCCFAPYIFCRLHAHSFVRRFELRATGFFRGLPRGCAIGILVSRRENLASALGGYRRNLSWRFRGGKDSAAHDRGALTMREAILLFFVICAGTGGELCVTRAMKRVGEVKDIRPHSLARVIFNALKIPWMWAGVSLMALAFFSLLAVLSIENVSFVVPVTALSYAAGALGGIVFLGERVSSRRWLGVLLVCLGVTLVWLGKR